ISYCPIPGQPIGAEGGPGFPKWNDPARVGVHNLLIFNEVMRPFPFRGLGFSISCFGTTPARAEPDALFPYNPPMNVPSSSPFFRPGGRTPAQLRPLSLTPDFVRTAEGSVLVSLGNT